MAQHYLSSYGYKHWGWIEPNGKIVDGAKSDFNNHYELLKDLLGEKFANSGHKIEKDGWVRWASDKDGNMHFEFMNPKSIPNVIRFIKLTSVAHTFTFDHPKSDRSPMDEKKALIWLKNLGKLQENTNLDEYSKWPIIRDGMIGDLEITDKIDNKDSIGATFDDYMILKGIREIPLDDLGEGPGDSHQYSQRVKDLADQISTNKRIMPLIVAVDADGPWILEGAHRIDALDYLKYKSIPALVVISRDGVLKEMHNFAKYKNWGWVDDEGVIIDGDEVTRDGTHDEICREAGFSSHQALKAGWIRWLIDDEELNAEYLPSKETSKHLIKFITKSKYHFRTVTLDEPGNGGWRYFDNDFKAIQHLKKRLT